MENNGSFLISMLPLLLILPIMYFLIIRPQKKKDQETAKMRNSINVGDEVVTIGGIIGKVVRTKDDSLVIQVGADKVKFEIMRWGVSRVLTEAKRTKGGHSEEEEAPKKKPKRIRKTEDVLFDETVPNDVPAENAPAENSVETDDSGK